MDQVVNQKRVIQKQKPTRMPHRYLNQLIETDSRYLEPVVCHEIPDEFLYYENARQLAINTRITKDSCQRHWLDGRFIFGDFIEALFVENNIHTELLSIGTLGMSEANVDSLCNLLDGGYVDRLELIISAYLFSHEMYGLIPYLFQKLDVDERFQLAVAGYHGKICLFKTDGGKYVDIHGSANLRSSSNIEHFMVQESRELYECDMLVHARIMEKFNIINYNSLPPVIAKFQQGLTPTKEELKKVKPLRHKALWGAVTTNPNN